MSHPAEDVRGHSVPKGPSPSSGRSVVPGFRMDTRAVRRVAKQSPRTSLAVALALIALTLSSGKFNQTLTQEEHFGFDVVQLVLLSVYTLSALLLLRRPRIIVESLTKQWSLTLLVLLAAISACWSDTPEVTAARALALCGATIFGVYLSAQFTIHDLVRLLGWSLAAVGVASAVTVLMSPGVGVDASGHLGAWQGIYAQKNSLGRAMAFGTIVWLLLAIEQRTRSLQAAFFAIAAAGIATMAGSVTTIAVIVAVVVSLLALRAMNWRVSNAVLLSCLTTIAASLIWATLRPESTELLDVLGRDDTLTGRTVLWGEVVERALARPLLGFGYGSFWAGWDSAAANVWRVLGWTPNDSHNGLLDLWLDLGVTGIIAFLITLVTGICKGLKYAHKGSMGVRWWPFTFFGMMVLYNLTESSILRPTSLFWLMYVALSSSLAKDPSSTKPSGSEGRISAAPPQSRYQKLPSRGERSGLHPLEQHCDRERRPRWGSAGPAMARANAQHSASSPLGLVTDHRYRIGSEHHFLYASARRRRRSSLSNNARPG
jgi:exopolysaccharide production protein ExoQ